MQRNRSKLPRMTRATFKKKSLRLPAFAKINLCLHVVGKRPDGYHELRTIFQAISLRDTLEFSIAPGSSGFHFTLTSNDATLLGPENLVARVGGDAAGNQISRRRVRAFGKKDSGGARNGRRVERRGCDSDRHAATDRNEAAAGAADGNRGGLGRGCAVLSVWRTRAGGESR